MHHARLSVITAEIRKIKLQAICRQIVMPTLQPNFEHSQQLTFLLLRRPSCVSELMHPDSSPAFCPPPLSSLQRLLNHQRIFCLKAFNRELSSNFFTFQPSWAIMFWPFMKTTGEFCRLILRATTEHACNDSAIKQLAFEIVSTTKSRRNHSITKL